MKKRVLIAFGTRPEALKFAPLIKALQAAPDFECLVCITGQHRQMLDQVVDFFDLPVDADLKLMRVNQTLEYVSGRVISRFGQIIRSRQPDIVFVQGDTATALMVGIASFYARVPIAHLEAGLRTWNKFQPFPEEMNRKLLSHIADIHFTPTAASTRNLINEGISREFIHQIGNTIVDTVELAREQIRSRYPVFKKLVPGKKILFVTAHRRESFGEGLKQIFAGLKKIAQARPDIQIVYPVHLNPQVAGPAHEMLGKVQGIHLMRPFSYEETCWVLEHCYAVLTDSGGIQEEAPSFHKPVLILRNVTERAEGIKAGCARLVGTDAVKIYRETLRLLDSPRLYASMQAGKNPYGDGHSCSRILKVLRRELRSGRLNTESRPVPKTRLTLKKRAR